MPETEPPPKPKLRVPDVAARYTMSERHVRQRVFERTIPYYKVGKLVLFDQDELDAWFQEHKVEAVD